MSPPLRPDFPLKRKSLQEIFYPFVLSIKELAYIRLVQAFKAIVRRRASKSHHGLPCGFPKVVSHMYDIEVEDFLAS